MGFTQLLDNFCSITHLEKASEPGVYGLPSEETYNYPITPHLTEVSCYVFHKGVADSAKVEQGGPNHTIRETIKLILLVDTDIRLNDRIEVNEVTYIAGVPLNLRGHHIEVRAARVADNV